MFSLFRILSLRYLRLRRSRAALVVLSIALGVTAWVATGALSRSLQKAIHDSANPLAGFADLYVSNGEAGVRADFAGRLRAVPGVRAIRPLLFERVSLPADHQPVILWGFEKNSPEPEGGGKSQVEITWQPPNPLAFLGGARPAVVGEQLDARLPREADGTFRVLAAGKTHRLVPVGVIRASGPMAMLGGNAVLLDVADAGAVVGRPGLVDRFDIQAEPGADLEAVSRGVEEVLGGQARVATPKDQHDRIRNMLAGLEVGFFLCGAAALVVGMFLVYNSLAVSVAERRHDIGVMRSLGATRGQVRLLFLAEAALLGLAGTLLGVPLGLGGAELLLGWFQNRISDVFVPLSAEHIDLAGLRGNVIAAVIAGVSTALLAALVPSSQAAAEEPADAVRRAPRSATWRYRLLHLAGCLLPVAAGFGLITAKGSLPQRVGAYTGIAVLFVGGLLAMPLVTAAAARLLRPLVRPLLGVSARLAADNLERAPGRTGLVIGALAAGVALVVHTAGLIESNEHAMRAWVSDTIRADTFITSGGPISASGQNLVMGADVHRHLEREFGGPGFHIVGARFRHLPWDQGRKKVELLLVALDAAAYHDANAERPDPPEHLALFRRLAEEPGTVVVSENFLNKQGRKVGDTMTLTGPRGPVPLRIIGAVVDYTWVEGTLFVDRRWHRDDFDTGHADVYDCYLPPEMDVEDFRARVEQSSWGAEQALAVVTRDELRGRIIDIIHRLYGMAYTQEVVVAFVVGLGVTAALLISVLQRRRELGLLRAVGATQWQVLASVLAEALLMGAIGTALGLMFGLALEWYAIHELLFDEAGFRFPVHYPWAAAGVIAGLAMLLATAAGLLPAVQAGRLPIAEAVAYE